LDVREVTSDPLVLIVEDDADIAEILEGYLRQAGYRTVVTGDGLHALELFFRQRPDLLLLDLNLPSLSGLEVLRSVREASAVPVIALTARVTQEDHLTGFSFGADDYITKPFWPLEVVARVAAVLRRAGAAHPNPGIEVGDLCVNAETRLVSRAGRDVRLRPAEFEILMCLLRAPGRVFTRSELLAVCTDRDSEALERTVDSHVARLRSSLGADHKIDTVHGLGYRYAG
jgi:two-component system, OmpR family, response regulator AdeR